MFQYFGAPGKSSLPARMSAMALALWAMLLCSPAVRADPVNLAAGKPTTSSSNEDVKGNTSDKAVDADATTRWCAANGDTPQWWEVDLGKPFHLNGVDILWEKDGVTYKYLVEGSGDNVNWATLSDQQNNDKKTQDQALTFDAGGIRYVRITVTALDDQTWASFFEFKVFGTAADPVKPTDLALHQSTTSSSDEVTKGNSSDKAVDGDVTTRWCAANADTPQWWEVDLGKPADLSSADILWEKDGVTYKYLVEGSGDNVNWTTLSDQQNSDKKVQDQNLTFNAKGIRYVRVTTVGLDDQCWASFFRVAVMGVPAGAAVINTAAAAPTPANAAPTNAAPTNAAPTNAAPTNAIPTSTTAASPPSAPTDPNKPPPDPATDPVTPVRDTAGQTPNPAGQNLDPVTPAVASANPAAGPTTPAAAPADPAADPTPLAAASTGPATAVPASRDSTVPTGVNLALGKTATASTNEAMHAPSNALDGDATTRWCAADGDVPQWWQVDLGKPSHLTGLEILWEKDGVNYKYNVEGSADGKTWTTLSDQKNNDKKDQDQKLTFDAGGIRYVRVTVTSLDDQCWASFFELKVLGPRP